MSQDQTATQRVKALDMIVAVVTEQGARMNGTRWDIGIAGDLAAQGIAQRQVGRAHLGRIALAQAERGDVVIEYRGCWPSGGHTGIEDTQTWENISVALTLVGSVEGADLKTLIEEDAYSLAEELVYHVGFRSDDISQVTGHVGFLVDALGAWPTEIPLATHLAKNGWHIPNPLHPDAIRYGLASRKDYSDRVYDQPAKAGIAAVFAAHKVDAVPTDEDVSLLMREHDGTGTHEWVPTGLASVFAAHGLVYVA